MKSIKIVKMSGSGNLFVVADNRQGVINGVVSEFAKGVCHNQDTEGLILVEHSDGMKLPFKMHFFNPDGTEPGLCGNGARCIAYYAKKELGIKEDPDGLLRFEVHGGVPIGARVNLDESRVQISMHDVTGYVSDKLTFENAGFDLNAVTASPVAFAHSGVPHTIVWARDLDEVDLIKIGKKVHDHELFRGSGGTNVNFVRVVDDFLLDIRTYERGVEDETGACGTGAVAAAFVAAVQERVKPEKGTDAYRIELRPKSGENLQVDFVLDVQDQNAGRVKLNGKVEILSHDIFQQ